jgi:HEAT repeat protein
MEAVEYVDVALGALVALILAALVIVRVRAGRRRARLAAAHERYEHLIAQLLAGDEPVPAPSGLHGLERQGLLEAGLDALLELRGRERERVAALLEDAGLVDAQTETLRRGRPVARRHAVDTLGMIASPGTQEPLREALGDSDSLVRLAAARGLAEVGEPGDEDAMSEVADAVARHHAGEVAELVLALGARSPDRLAPLYERSRSDDVRRIVIAAIGELRLGMHVGLLRSALDGDDELAARAARGLGAIGDSQSTPALLQVVADTGRTWFVRAAASTALGELGDPAAVTALTAELRAEEWPRRRAGAEALAKLGPGGQAALEAAAAEPSTEARRHAAAALDR